MKSKNNITTITMVTALVAVSIALTGCGEKTNLYPAKNIIAFIDACVETGAPTKRCSCVIDFLRKNMSFDDFIAEETEMLTSGKSSPDLIKQMTNARIACN